MTKRKERETSEPLRRSKRLRKQEVEQNEGVKEEENPIYPYKKIDIKPNLMDLAKSPYFHGLKDEEKVKFQEFFNHAITTSAAWEVYDDEEKKYYSVQGQAVQEVLFNYNLDVSLVLYYTYKRILAARKKPRKYIKFCITPPWASLVGIQEWIDKGVSMSTQSISTSTSNPNKRSVKMNLNHKRVGGLHIGTTECIGLLLVASYNLLST